jgi:hemolysin III
VVYVRQWPNPAPTSFGYHEVFHAFVVAAAVVHFVAIAGYALPHAA